MTDIRKVLTLPVAGEIITDDVYVVLTDGKVSTHYPLADGSGFHVLTDPTITNDERALLNALSGRLTINEDGELTFDGNVLGAGVPEVLDIITSFTVTEGDPRDTVTVTSTEGGAIYFGLYPAGTLASDVDGTALKAGNDAGQIDVAAGGTLPVGGGTSSDVEFQFPDVTNTEDTDYTLAVVIEDASGAFSEVHVDTFTNNAVVAAGNPIVDTLGIIGVADTSSTTNTAFLESASYASGDTIILAHGTDDGLLTARIDLGSGLLDLALIGETGSTKSGLKQFLYALTLTEDVAATQAVVSFDYNSGFGLTTLIAVVARQSSIHSSDFAFDEGGAQMSLTNAAPDGPSTLIGFVTGNQDAVDADLIAGNATLVDFDYAISESGRGAALFVDNVGDVSAVTSAYQQDAGDLGRLGVSTVVIS